MQTNRSGKSCRLIGRNLTPHSSIQRRLKNLYQHLKHFCCCWCPDALVMVDDTENKHLCMYHDSIVLKSKLCVTMEMLQGRDADPQRNSASPVSCAEQTLLCAVLLCVSLERERIGLTHSCHTRDRKHVLAIK